MRQEISKIIILFTLCFFLKAILWAQEKEINGKVTDENGVPLSGVNIVVKETDVGTQTDFDGIYVIKVRDGDVLKFTFVGMDAIEKIVGKEEVTNVVMRSNKSVLDEVVIGYDRKDRLDLTEAVSSVSGEELRDIPAMTTAQALQGKAAGLNIVTASGAPGAGVNVTIRGGASITQSTEPLYIVDGFEMGNALERINPADIESVEVLKDASATSIYGARGSNGVIVITTKSGEKGKTKVTYRTFISFDKLSKRLNMISNSEEFAEYQYEIAELQGKTTQWNSVFDNSLAVDDPLFYSSIYDRIRDRYASDYAIDWQNKVFGGSALTENHNINVSTGTEKTQVLLSYDYKDQDGFLANHSQKRNSFRARVNSELDDNIRLDLNTIFTDVSTYGGGAYSGLKDVLLQPINGGSLFTKEEMLEEQTFPDFSALDSSYDTSNPLVQNQASISRNRSRNFIVNAGVEFDFLRYFTWRSAGQYAWSSGKSTSFSDENSIANLTDPENTGINGSIGNSESYKYQITNTLKYDRTFFDKHKIGILLGQELIYDNSENNSISLKQFPYPNFGLNDISNATVSGKGSGRSHSELISGFARLNYIYDDRYLLTATIRGDGSSKFAKGNQWGIFPSASGAWRISKERFWKRGKIQDIINNLKFRLGYGLTGNNGIGDNLYRTNVVQTDYPLNNKIGNPAYVTSATLGNENLKWESVHSTNIGMDISLFNSRLKLTTEWYNNKVTDMLMKSLIPVSTGYSDQYQNVGVMRNRGWEFTLNSVNIESSDFRWTTNLNLSTNKSKVLSLERGQDIKTFSVGSNRSGSVRYYAKVGEELGGLYGFVYDGVYQTSDFVQEGDGSLSLREGVVKPYEESVPEPGDIKFAADDIENNRFTREFVRIGNGAPDFVGGFSNQFNYNGLDLNIFMKFSVGNDVYNATKHSMSPYALFQNTPEKFGQNYYRVVDPKTGKKASSLDRLKELNPNEDSRTWSLNNTNSSYITYPSSYYVEDGSYLRLAQVTLGYTLPERLLDKVNISFARIYTTINNLATITGYSGYDPEVTAASGVTVTPGYDSSTYPRSRSFVLGLELEF